MVLKLTKAEFLFYYVVVREVNKIFDPLLNSCNLTRGIIVNLY